MGEFAEVEIIDNEVRIYDEYEVVDKTCFTSINIYELVNKIKELANVNNFSLVSWCYGDWASCEVWTHYNRGIQNGTYAVVKYADTEIEAVFEASNYILSHLINKEVNKAKLDTDTHLTETEIKLSKFKDEFSNISKADIVDYIMNMQDKIDSLEENIHQLTILEQAAKRYSMFKQKENIQLKSEISELEKTVVKMRSCSTCTMTFCYLNRMLEFNITKYDECRDTNWSKYQLIESR